MGGADSILKGQAYFINRSSRHLGHKLGRSLIAYKWESILGGQANGTYEAWWPCKMFVEHADHGLLVRLLVRVWCSLCYPRLKKM